MFFFCSQPCLLPTPEGTSCANYARFVNQILQGLTYLQSWLRAPLVKSDGDSKDAFPYSLVYELTGGIFCFLRLHHESCFAVGVLHVMLKRGFAFSVYNLNILLEGLCKNLEYGKTVTLL
ncbi:hypothetical protein Bca4012_056197 [Brassica carinata]